MIDNNKRTTLKGIAAVAGAVAAASIPTLASAGSRSESVMARGGNSVRQVWPPIAVKSPIELSTHVSSEKNDIEVVLTNRSKQTVTMTQIIPSTFNTPHGTSAFDDVLQNGHRQLAAGESMCVPIRHATNGSVDSPKRPLRSGLSISTSENHFCAVSYAVVA